MTSVDEMEWFDAGIPREEDWRHGSLDLPEDVIELSVPIAVELLDSLGDAMIESMHDDFFENQIHYDILGDGQAFACGLHTDVSLAVQGDAQRVAEWFVDEVGQYIETAQEEDFDTDFRYDSSRADLRDAIDFGDIDVEFGEAP